MVSSCVKEISCSAFFLSDRCRFILKVTDVFQCLLGDGGSAKHRKECTPSRQQRSVHLTTVHHHPHAETGTHSSLCFLLLHPLFFFSGSGESFANWFCRGNVFALLFLLNTPGLSGWFPCLLLLPTQSSFYQNLLFFWAVQSCGAAGSSKTLLLVRGFIKCLREELCYYLCKTFLILHTVTTLWLWPTFVTQRVSK